MSNPPAKSRAQPAIAASPVIIPDELIPEVLSFANVKTLMKMKCVCKSWKSIISDPEFLKLHLKRSALRPHLTLFLSKSRLDGDNNVVPFPVSRLIENPLITLPDDQDSRLKDKDCRYVIGSCNGLLCLLGYSSTAAYREIWLRFWNPAVGKISYKLGYFVDNVLGLYTHFKFAFGYDISSETYKVVLLVLDEARNSTEVRVFSLGHNVWRTIQNFPAVPLPFRYSHPGVHDGVYLNGSLNWLALHSNFRSVGSYGWKNINNVKEFVIISLDLGTETYRQLMPPRGFDEVSPVEPSVCVLMDCLCFCNDFKRSEFVIWQMKIFGVEESWTQLLKISYQNLQRHHNFVDSQYSQWLPLHLSDHSGTLILVNNQERQAFLYNLRDNSVVRTRITDEIHWFSAKVYVESFVSDNLNLKVSAS